LSGSELWRRRYRGGTVDPEVEAGMVSKRLCKGRLSKRATAPNYSALATP